MATTLPPDFREFLQYLRTEKVEYLLVGGWAVGVHGHPRDWTRIGVPPFRIDIMTWVSALDFEEFYARRLTTTLDEVDVDVIGREDLLKNKRATGRLKDLADAEALE